VLGEVVTAWQWAGVALVVAALVGDAVPLCWGLGVRAACSKSRVLIASPAPHRQSRRPTTHTRIARDELTTIGASGRQPALTVATASPPWAPTPGINNGTVGATARTRSISAG
jgi:hypothetical protein